MVVQGQAVYAAPQPSTMTYRSTRDTLELTTDTLAPGHVVVARAGDTVSAVQDGKPAVTLGGAPAVIAPQAIAEFIWYTPELTSLAVGGKRTLTAAEVRTEGALVVDLGRFTFTRVPDAGGLRVYDFAGKHGQLELTGRLTLAADGLPAEVSITIKYGTITFRRVAGG
jgi:hypothetical protein